MGLRQLVWALIAALLVYGGWQFMRALLAARKSTVPSSSPTETRRPADADESFDEDGEAADDEGFNYAPLPAATAQPVAGAQKVSAERTEYFALELDLQRLRREVSALRAALGVQQGEIGALHDEVKRLGERAPTPPAVNGHSPMQDTSPEYGEALVLARRGLGVEEIASRCDITRAEAELVVSLAARGDTEGS